MILPFKMGSLAPLLRRLSRTLLSSGLALMLSPGVSSAAEKPNIVYILCDDLGYGDVHCLNPEGKIPTPNLDRLAAAGMKFTDAHSSSAVCTPTRYGILTGRYNWRSSLKRGVLNGFSPRLIEPHRLTVAAFLKQEGYATACIGKWHLGLNWPQKNGGSPGASEDKTIIDYSKPIEGGPTTLGFDYFFGISASLDMFPFVYIENDRVTEIPAVEKQWLRKGPAGPNFDAIDVLPTLTKKAVEFINQQTAQPRRGAPYFLYLPLTSPHTPILPTPEWQGKSGLNPYADFVMQTDAAIGYVINAIDANGLATNTLVIFASDNGCSPSANYPELLSQGHNPGFKFRGAKADIFEGGHRIPFIVRWPAKVAPATTSDQLICLTDLFATCAEILGKMPPPNAAEDSVSILPALVGRATHPLREAVVHHSINGSFSIRQGKWKLELCPDSGGWSPPKPDSPEAQGLPPVQLYNVSTDVGETQNLQSQHPDIVQKLTRLLESYVAQGRSTPGPKQENTGEVHPRGTPKPVK